MEKKCVLWKHTADEGDWNDFKHWMEMEEYRTVSSPKRLQIKSDQKQL